MVFIVWLDDFHAIVDIFPGQIYFTMGDISPEFYSSNFLSKIKGLIPPVSINKENELFFELQELKNVHISVFI